MSLHRIDGSEPNPDRKLYTYLMFHAIVIERIIYDQCESEFFFLLPYQIAK